MERAVRPHAAARPGCAVEWPPVRRPARVSWALHCWRGGERWPGRSCGRPALAPGAGAGRTRDRTGWVARASPAHSTRGRGSGWQPEPLLCLFARPPPASPLPPAPRLTLRGPGPTMPPRRVLTSPLAGRCRRSRVLESIRRTDAAPRAGGATTAAAALVRGSRSPRQPGVPGADRAGRRNRRPPRQPGRPAPTAIYHQGGPARALPHRPVRGAAGPGGADSRLQRDPRQAYRSRLHPQGPGHLVGGDGPLPGAGWCQARHGAPRRLRLWPVHRRARLPYGRGAPGLPGDPDVEREHRPADPDDARHRLPDARLHPFLRAHLAGALAEQGIQPSQLRLESGMFGAEPWTEGMRQAIEQGLGLRAYDIYGLSEVIGPGVSAECQEQDGLHIQEDHFLPEIVDPASGEPLPEGAEGELVLTSLTKEALPAIRYRTGDVTALTRAPCRCGRTSSRMARIKGRCDDMLIIRGVNLYPSEVERVLLRMKELAPHYQLLLRRERALDELEVQVEVAETVLAR